MNARGTSVLELLVAMSIVITVLGAVMRVVTPAGGAAAAQADLQDMAQRARVATDILVHDLRMAGAGPMLPPLDGPLFASVPPVVPAAWAGAIADAPGTARADRLTVTYVAPRAVEALSATTIGPDALELHLASGPSCPPRLAACGFADGDLLLVFDGSGQFDTFRLDLSAPIPRLRPLSVSFSATYAPGAEVVQAVSRTFYHDGATSQLLVQEGDGSAQPLADHVSLLEFAYLGDAGAPIPLDTLADGPWRGTGGTLYDADLSRVRAVRLALGIRRASAGGLFVVPDLRSNIQVALRNAAVP